MRFEQSWPALVSKTFEGTPEGIRTYQIWHGIAATSDGASLAQVARGMASFDIPSRLGKLKMPVLFIAGAAHISNVDSSDGFTEQQVAFL